MKNETTNAVKATQAVNNESKEKEMKEILERIAKSLESIDAELKARNEDRKILINQAELIERTCLEIKEDPFGLGVRG